MKNSFRVLSLSHLLVLAVGPVAALRAANVTGDGYIHLTQPTTAWSPVNLADTPRFIWYPDKASFRFGELSSSHADGWSGASVGHYSFGGGKNALAMADHSFAFGDNAFAYGLSSVALGGSWTEAMGDNSVAISGGYAIGYGSVAISAWAGGHGSLALAGGGASGDYSIAVGGNATGEFSIALGDGAQATGTDSASILGGQSVGTQSLAILWANAIADGSVAIGLNTLATSQYGVALGTANKSKRRNGSSPDPQIPQPDDPLLMVGNSTTFDGQDASRSNALTVYRDGQAHFAGTVRVPQSGDIPMGGYTAKPAGVVFP